MKQEEILRRVQKCAAESLGIDDAEATPEKSLDDLGADSLDRVEFAMCLEDEFEVTVTDSEGAAIRTIQQAVEFVATRVAK